ncbi:putative leucine-rich repeat receptor-like protein kinase At2g19210 isoform X2 [Nymphaea colorata]|nr:putative leucine-rich repeat receptor-like protein kinase At2g19210 isoform X2 [Nymphaea colorata]
MSTWDCVYLLLCATLYLRVGGAQEGFISLDCGASDGTSYKSDIGLSYTSDDSYISSGVAKQISSDYLTSSIAQIYHRVRSFPQYTRNCYTLGPLTLGWRYIVRASFMYGNYDGLSSVPNFDLYMGLDLWNMIQLDNATHVLRTEIIKIATSTSLSVCLLKTNNSMPSISGLELRPYNGIYSPENGSSLVTFKRIDFGSTKESRFPADPYDRIWTPDYNAYGTPISTDLQVKEVYDKRFGLPTAIMQTAVTSSTPITISWTTSADIYIFMHFAELIQYKGNQTRNLTIAENGQSWTDPFSLDYLVPLTVYSTSPDTLGDYSFSIGVAKTSTLGPIVNAIEIYEARDVTGFSTNQQDVDAITGVRDNYGLKKNWISDPCLPQRYPWDGLDCSYGNPSSPRIISLDLSYSGLNGSITNYFYQLASIHSLNLSGNNLEGSIPDFLGKMTSLTTLDLSGNDFSCPIPSTLRQRMDDGSLSVRFDNNTQLSLDGTCKKKQHNVLLLVLSVCAPTIFLFVLGIVLIMILRRKKNMRQNQGSTLRGNNANTHTLSALESSCIFTYGDIVTITNNFERRIGKGGSADVFYGKLIDGREVAVKSLTRTSVQRSKEFAAEIKLLTKVHHKYLVSFYGFCEEGENMVLVYEYMSGGDLMELLSEDSRSSVVVSWKQRLEIGLSSATGLEYLHSGCRPPIIHRDVKTSNILLNKNLEAKIADFGLSKICATDDITHMTTAVAGTAGYMDPEYYNTNKLTEKSDVYSFGVVLLELITGHRAILTLESQRVHILQWVTPKIMRGDVASIVDPRLQGRYDINSIWKVVEVALTCGEEKAIGRPTMTEVVNGLKAALDIEDRGSIGGVSGKMSFEGHPQSDIDSSMYPSAR